MIIDKATQDTEAGVIPKEILIAKMLFIHLDFRPQKTNQSTGDGLQMVGHLWNQESTASQC
jgi:hypothetical protein